MPVPTARGVHSRALLRDEVFRSIRDAIVRGELAPGEKLRDAELGSWLGVSRTPIREALLRLESAGLVIAQPGKVTMVAPEDPAAVRHAQQVAAELHALAVTLATGQLSDTDFATMAEANERLRHALAAADAEAAISADDDFHQVPVARCANPVIGELLDSVTATLRRTEYLHFGSLTGADSPTQHEQIMAALRSENATEAASVTRTNWLGLSAG